MKQNYLKIFLLLFVGLSIGCVRNTLEVVTVPEGAKVIFDGREKGESPQVIDFDWYGGHRLKVQKDGYKTYNEIIMLKAPVYRYIPIDLLTDLWPTQIDDKHTVEIVLEPLAAGEVVSTTQ